jgi:hypothetical protein
VTFRLAKLDLEHEDARAPSGAQTHTTGQEKTGDGSLLDRVIDILTPQGKKIIKVLWNRKYATTYNTLADTSGAWRNEEPSDETIRTALKRVAKELNKHTDLGVTIKISHSEREVKRIPPPDKSGDK